MGAEFLSTREAAEILGMAQATVSRLIRKGKLEGHRLGGFFVVTRISVEVYAAAVKNKNRNDPTRRLRETSG
jgi:excisionase family DNA binding protein